MNAKEAKLQIKQLKSQLRAANHRRDMRLLKLTLLLLILVLISVFVHGRIQIL